MNTEMPPKIPEEQIIFDKESFTNWTCLNDSIMGGSSHAECSINDDGLVKRGRLL